MPDSGQITMTDVGEYLIGSFVTATGMIFWIDTPTVEVDFIGLAVPRRVMHAGWVSLASGDNASPSSELTFDVLQISWWSYFEHESNARNFYGGIPNIDRIIWQIPTGVVCKVQLWW